MPCRRLSLTALTDKWPVFVLALLFVFSGQGAPHAQSGSSQAQKVVPASPQKLVAAQKFVIVNGRKAVANEVLVKLKENPVYEEYVDLEWAVDADRSDAIGSRGARRIHSPWLETKDLLADFQTHSDVVYAEPNYVIDINDLPNDPYFSYLFGLDNTGQTVGTPGTSGADIDAVSAWTLTKGSRANVVAVIDTGIDYTHPDLAANVWSAPARFTVNVGGQSITCAAGTHGFNAITKSCNPMDDNSHGTHVSGTIGGVGNNGVGVAGVNWVASIMGIKFLDANGSGYTSDAVNGIEFAIQAKAAFASTGGANVRVLSNSWGGGGYSQALFDEISRANSNEMLFVAAAGNSANNNDLSASYPASYNVPNVVAVAATDNRDLLASFSSYGAKTVDLAAPGVNILSTTPSNTYSFYSGTSMATPHVAGAAALVLAGCPLSTAALKNALLNTVDLVPGLTAKTLAGGRLNVARAIYSCTSARVGTITLTADAVAPQPIGTPITWTAVPVGGTAPYQFQWWLHDGTSWTSLTGWTKSRTYTWTPTAVNAKYTVKVWVRSAWNTSDTTEAAAQVGFAISTRISRMTLTPNRTSPQPAPVTTAFTAVATGGKAPYSYKWYVHNGSTWSALTGWATTATYAWTPSAPGAYTIRAWSRSAGNSNDVPEALADSAFTVTSRVSGLTLRPNLVAPRLTNTTVTWTATASGGKAPYQYKWYATSNGSSWVLAKNWSTDTTFAWRPTAAGAGSAIKVWVRSSGNPNDVAEVITQVAYAIVAPISRVTMAPNRAAPQISGTTIAWTATATGGMSPQQYRFELTTDGITWTLARDWSTTGTFAWTPRSASPRYSVRALARSSVGVASEASATMAYVIK